MTIHRAGVIARSCHLPLTLPYRVLQVSHHILRSWLALIGIEVGWVGGCELGSK